MLCGCAGKQVKNYNFNPPYSIGIRYILFLVCIKKIIFIFHTKNFLNSNKIENVAVSFSQNEISY